MIEADLYIISDEMSLDYYFICGTVHIVLYHTYSVYHNGSLVCINIFSKDMKVLVIVIFFQ